MPMRRSPRILPFTPPAPRTPADPPTSANVAGGRLSKRRTLTPGLSMTLSLNVDELARALLRLEQEEGGKQGVQMTAQPSSRVLPLEPPSRRPQQKRRASCQ